MLQLSTLQPYQSLQLIDCNYHFSDKKFSMSVAGVYPSVIQRKDYHTGFHSQEKHQCQKANSIRKIIWIEIVFYFPRRQIIIKVFVLICSLSSHHITCLIFAKLSPFKFLIVIFGTYFLLPLLRFFKSAIILADLDPSSSLYIYNSHLQY